MINAAGILFVTRKGKRCLLLKRTGGDHSGEWCFPGGKFEPNESAEQAAVRETREEVGQCPDGDRAELCTITSEVGVTPFNSGAVAVGVDQVRFTTFVQIIDDEFDIKLDESEHSASMWCSLDGLPLGLHPGASVALRRFQGNELDVARMIAVGELPSPQQLDNMWLFALRITGTGTAYRDKHDEVVYRPPENYLSDDFLERCFGLPVIINHPVAMMMKEQDYVNRNVGSIRLPYVKGDEVWGVASIYDQKLAALMQEVQLSTSPGVVFKPQSSTNRTFNVDGTKLLIEGKAGLLDHLAICTAGVWDKGGSPLGVDSGAIEMPEPKKEVTNEQVLNALDRVLSSLGAISTRMDSLEDLERARKNEADQKADDGKWEARKDGEDDDAFAERRKQWETRKDSEDDAAYQKRMDENPVDEGTTKAANAQEPPIADKAANAPGGGDPSDIDGMRADNVELRKSNEALSKRLSALERSQPRQLSDAEINQFGEVQARADSVMSMFGKQAPRPMAGENVAAYKRRLANGLREHSVRFKAVDMAIIKDDAAFAPIEDIVYADALAVASSPIDVPAGQLREIRTSDLTGRRIISFVGQPKTWMQEFAAPTMRVTKIDKSAA